jgi:hypothetical protein
LQQLAVEAQRRGIPMSLLAQQMGLALPVAQAFGTTAGTSDMNKKMSGAEQFAMIAGGLGKLFGGGGKAA